MLGFCTCANELKVLGNFKSLEKVSRSLKAEGFSDGGWERIKPVNLQILEITTNYSAVKRKCLFRVSMTETPALDLKESGVPSVDKEEQERTAWTLSCICRSGLRFCPFVESHILSYVWGNVYSVTVQFLTEMRPPWVEGPDNDRMHSSTLEAGMDGDVTFAHPWGEASRQNFVTQMSVDHPGTVWRHTWAGRVYTQACFCGQRYVANGEDVPGKCYQRSVRPGTELQWHARGCRDSMCMGQCSEGLLESPRTGRPVEPRFHGPYAALLTRSL